MSQWCERALGGSLGVKHIFGAGWLEDALLPVVICRRCGLARPACRHRVRRHGCSLAGADIELTIRQFINGEVKSRVKRFPGIFETAPRG